MIIQCQGCAAKYFLPEEKVPEQPLKVKCPKCLAVFMLSPRTETAAVTATLPTREAAPPEVAPLETTTAFDDAIEASPPPPAEPSAAKASATADAPAAKKSFRRASGRSKEDRAKRLARVLVSDILWYNRDRRDEALKNGTLMAALGDEIKKSWELYKEKVGPEAAQSTNYFKEALNEILADGQEVF